MEEERQQAYASPRRWWWCAGHMSVPLVSSGSSSNSVNVRLYVHCRAESTTPLPPSCPTDTPTNADTHTHATRTHAAHTRTHPLPHASSYRMYKLILDGLRGHCMGLVPARHIARCGHRACPFRLASYNQQVFPLPLSPGPMQPALQEERSTQVRQPSMNVNQHAGTRHRRNVGGGSQGQDPRAGSKSPFSQAGP